ncbi:hypothetical protein CEXT_292241 [Caerostris extrusa]|uniref:Uncharacterized protein n=1 Tax=Caerostris extrusa TaxID=172846 RepID=A0AAV4SJF7_CAEEX|nr:hypothetical protein CEXT_292241 [Caerostris extrusa]
MDLQKIFKRGASKLHFEMQVAFFFLLLTLAHYPPSHYFRLSRSPGMFMHEAAEGITRALNFSLQKFGSIHNEVRLGISNRLVTTKVNHHILPHVYFTINPQN